MRFQETLRTRKPSERQLRIWVGNSAGSSALETGDDGKGWGFGTVSRSQGRGDMVQEGVSRNRDTHTDFQADASDHRDGTV